MYNGPPLNGPTNLPTGGNWEETWQFVTNGASNTSTVQYALRYNAPEETALFEYDPELELPPAPRALAEHLVVRRARPGYPRRALRAAPPSVLPLARWASTLKSFKR